MDFGDLFSSSHLTCVRDTIPSDRFLCLHCSGLPPLLLGQPWFVQCTSPMLTEFGRLWVFVVPLPKPKPKLIQFRSLLLQANFRLLFARTHLLVNLMNYKQHNKKYFCRGEHPTPARSTIQDHTYFSAGPTHTVFRQVQRIEFPRLDQRKVHALLRTLQIFVR